jgi:hypothetical protein
MRVIFVFGSNLAGQHAGGAARWAHENCAAVLGEGIGLTGNSYAIPTMDAEFRTMPLSRIKPHIDVFIDFAAVHPDSHFNLTRIGCGIAGYDWDRDIAPLLPATLPTNIQLMDPQ